MVGTFVTPQLGNAQAPAADSLSAAQDTIRDTPRDTARQAIRPNDTTGADTLARQDTSGRDTLSQAERDSLRRSRMRANSDFKAPVNYQAQDSMTLEVGQGTITLYNKAEMDYQDMQLKAKRVKLYNKENIIEANGVPDSSGQLQGTPVFKDGEQKYEAKGMRYNFRTQKGIISYAQTQQEQDQIEGDSIKRMPDNSYYVKNAKFTSCKEEDPDFYFRSRRVKVIPQDKIISGPAVMYVANIPTPLVIPFGFYPQMDKRSSGIILPEYGDSQQLGFFLRNMGYYWAVSDNLGLRMTGDLYTKGSFGFHLKADYIKRYWFNGNLNLDYELIGNDFERDDPAFSSRTIFRINGQHSQTINPHSNLSADINISSRAQRVTSQEHDQYLQNKLQSSISYSNSIPNSKWTLTASAQHSQELNADPSQPNTVNLSLPNINLNRARWQPFQRAVPTGGPKWYENIGINYSMNASNSVQTIDSLLFRRETLDDWRNGITHNVGVNSSFKLLEHIKLNPNMNYSEYWTFQQTRQDFVLAPEVRQVQDTIQQGDSLVPVDRYETQLQGRARSRSVNRFTTGRDFNMGMSMNTTFYGFWQPPTQKNNQLTFRHLINPSLNYTYRPDFSAEQWGFYKTVQTNLQGNTRQYSIFEGTGVGGPPAGEQQSLGLNINNQLSGKYLPQPKGGQQDTARTGNDNGEPAEKQFKYFGLLDNFNFGANYNFARDSFNLSNINFSGNTNVAEGLFNFNLSGSIDPYRSVDTAGLEAQQPRYVRVNQFAWHHGGGLGRLTQMRFSTQLRLNNPKERRQPNWSQMAPRRRQYMQQYAPMDMKWNLSLDYSLNYNRPTPEPPELSHSLGLNGSWKPTDKWDLNVRTHYDFRNNTIAGTFIDIQRDLGCWAMSFQWRTPFGRNPSYQLRIYVKSPKLKDLKIEKRNLPQDRITR